MRHALHWYAYICVFCTHIYACLAKAHRYVRQKYAYTRVQKTHIYRNNIASTPTSSTSSNTDLSLSDSTSIKDPKDSDESPKDSEPLATIVPSKKKKSQEIDPIDKYLISAINDKKCEKVKEDSNDLFCKSITDILRKFPPKKTFR